MTLLTPDSLVLVSGGARGVTAHCVVELARRYHCRFLLLGRSAPTPEPAWAIGADDETELKRRAADALRSAGDRPAPAAIGRLVAGILASREIMATLAAVDAAGGRAEYLAADVTDRASLAAALEPALARLGRPVGLVHGAGALADRAIERKTPADFELVYGTKVRGLANLLHVVPPADLDLLVLFTSAAGFFGNPGQSDYALANEVLNRVAYSVQATNPRCRVAALNWGPWDGGMVDAGLKRLFAERGVDLIPLDEGARTLVDVLEHPDRPVEVVVGGPLAPTPRPPSPNTQHPTPIIHRIWRTLTLAGNPFVRDHVVGGSPVLPTVCAVKWMSDVGEGLFPGHRLFAVDDLRVLKGIVFDGELADRSCCELDEVDADQGRVTYRATVWSQTPGGAPRYHYRARVTLLDALPPAPRYTAVDLREDANARDGAAIYRDGTLFHGPAFQGVERLLNASPQRLTLACLLPRVDDAVQGQFPARRFNAYVADAQFQAQVIWGRLFHGAASLPLSCHRGELYRPLPFDHRLYVTVEVRQSDDHGVTADLTTHDADGLVYLRLEGASVTLSRALNELFQPASG